jgi:alpha-tubulin suppressor-like RCC1 family protein
MEQQQHLDVGSDGVVKNIDALDGLVGKPLALDRRGRILAEAASSAKGGAQLVVDEKGALRITRKGDSDVVIRVAAGGTYSLFLTSDGTAYSCGYNDVGQLGRAVAAGDELTVNLDVISALSGVTVIDITAGLNGSHSLFLTSDLDVYSCGDNTYGQLGRAVASGDETTVNLGVITGLPEIAAFAAGQNQSFFITADGDVYSCGYNWNGQLGRAVASGDDATVNLGLIDGLSDVASASSGYYHTLFRTNGNEAYSCGKGLDGQLGRDVADGDESTVNLGLIDALSDVIAIAAGCDYSLFVVAGGTAYSCGFNWYGQLGRVTSLGQYTPLGVVDTVTNVAVVAAGWMHSLFITSTGAVYSCGFNYFGGLGRVANDGYAFEADVSIIPGLGGVVAAAAGHSHSFFLTADGRVYNCGNNSGGRLGRAVTSGSREEVNLGMISRAYLPMAEEDDADSHIFRIPVFQYAPVTKAKHLVTREYMDWQLVEKAGAAHGHAISGVAGLQAALDGKSDTDHTHDADDIDGLDEAIAELVGDGEAQVITLEADVDEYTVTHTLGSTILVGACYDVATGRYVDVGIRIASSTSVVISLDANASIGAGVDELRVVLIRSASGGNGGEVDVSDVDGLQAALDAKASIASPALTGTPTAPTATAGTDTTQIATTAFVAAALDDKITSGTDDLTAGSTPLASGVLHVVYE